MDKLKVVQFSHDCELMVSGHYDGMVKIWNVKTGKLIKTWMVSDVPIKEVAFNHDNKQVVVVSDKITIYNIDNKQSITLYGYKGEARTAVFNHDGTIVASGHENNIYIWDAKTGNLLIELKAHQGNVNSVAFNHDGTKIVSGSSDKTIKIWDVKFDKKIKGKVYPTISFLKEFKDKNAIILVSYNHDSTKILSQDSSFKSANIWDVKTGKCLYTIKVNADMYEATFNYNSTKIVSTNEDESIKIWDVKTGDLLYIVDTPGNVHLIGFNSDNRMILLVEDIDYSDGFNISTWDLQKRSSQEISLDYDRSSPKTVMKYSNNTVIKKKRNTFCNMSEKDLYDMVSHSYKRNGNYTYKTQDAEIKVILWKSNDQLKAKLISYKLDNIIFQDSNNQLLHIIYDISLEQIEIKYVYIGAGKGICTKAVAYTMRSLIDYINRQNKFALNGTVYIQSENPCAAFNCYNRAFRMNGFELSNDKEYENYKKELKKDVDVISYTFKSFINKKQQLMKQEYKLQLDIKKLQEEKKKVNIQIKKIKKLGPKLKF